MARAGRVIPHACDARRYPRIAVRARLLDERGPRLQGPALREPGHRLRSAFDAAHKRKVKIITFSFCALDEQPGKVYSYGLDEKDLEAFWKHKIILVVDHARTLMGGAEPEDDSDAVVTGHPAINEVALNNIALDITLLSQR